MRPNSALRGDKTKLQEPPPRMVWGVKELRLNFKKKRISYLQLKGNIYRYV